MYLGLDLCLQSEYVREQLVPHRAESALLSSDLLHTGIQLGQIFHGKGLLVLELCAQQRGKARQLVAREHTKQTGETEERMRLGFRRLRRQIKQQPGVQRCTMRLPVETWGVPT